MTRKPRIAGGVDHLTDRFDHAGAADILEIERR
jgi:hypothetical protein